MDTQQQQEGPRPELAEATQALLARRNLTVNAATQRYGLDRNALTRMWNGVPASLEFTEKFARTFGEDVNRWRVLAGYPPILAEPTADYGTAGALLEGIQQIAKETGQPIEIDADLLSLPRATPDDVARVLAAIRQRTGAT